MNWETNILPLLKNLQFDKHLNNKKVNWLECALALNSIGHPDKELMRSIVETRYVESLPFYNKNHFEELKKILNHAFSTEIDTNEPAAIHANISNDLENIIGVDKIWHNFSINNMFTLPFVVKLDLNTGNFMPIKEAPSVDASKPDELL